jgi:hypothetical protein
VRRKEERKKGRKEERKKGRTNDTRNGSATCPSKLRDYINAFSATSDIQPDRGPAYQYFPNSNLDK